MAFLTAQPSHQALRNIVAERTRPLLAWVGAGLSKPAGMPTWGDLRDTLVEALRLKAAAMDSSGAGKARALADHAARENNLWHAFELLHEGLQPASFRDQIRTALQPAVRVDVPEAYRLLWQLPIAESSTSTWTDWRRER
jgi:eukaryotic-like serine/threonine-protein kinase